MSNRTGKPAQEREPARTRESDALGQKPERAGTDARDESDPQEPVASRPRGKTEDPDRTL